MNSRDAQKVLRLLDPRRCPEEVWRGVRGGGGEWRCYFKEACVVVPVSVLSFSISDRSSWYSVPNGSRRVPRQRSSNDAGEVHKMPPGSVRCWQRSADAGKVYHMLAGSIRCRQGPSSLKMVAASLKMVAANAKRRAAQPPHSRREVRPCAARTSSGRRSPGRRGGRASKTRCSPPQAWRLPDQAGRAEMASMALAPGARATRARREARVRSCHVWKAIVRGRVNVAHMLVEDHLVGQGRALGNDRQRPWGTIGSDHRQRSAEAAL